MFQYQMTVSVDVLLMYQPTYMLSSCLAKYTFNLASILHLKVWNYHTHGFLPYHKTSGRCVWAECILGLYFLVIFSHSQHHNVFHSPYYLAPFLCTFDAFCKYLSTWPFNHVEWVPVLSTHIRNYYLEEHNILMILIAPLTSPLICVVLFFPS